MNKPDLVIGYTTRKHLLLDLDDTTYIKATRVIDMLFKEFPEIGDCLIVISSVGKDEIKTKYDNFQRLYHKRDRLNIHLIFDNLIGYNKASRICEILAGLFIINKGYSDIRRFRGDLTLRISPKVNRYKTLPYPRILAVKINKFKKRKDGYIRDYISLLGFSRRLFLPRTHTEHITGDSSNTRDHSSEISAIKPHI